MFKLKELVILAGLLVSTAAVAEGTMTVGEFLRSIGAEAGNPAAFIDEKVRLAWADYGQALEDARSEEAAAKAAGKAPPFCIPAKTQISQADVVRYFKSQSASGQSLTLKLAVHTWMTKKFPCESKEKA